MKGTNNVDAKRYCEKPAAMCSCSLHLLFRLLIHRALRSRALCPGASKCAATRALCTNWIKNKLMRRMRWPGVPGRRRREQQMRQVRCSRAQRSAARPLVLIVLPLAQRPPLPGPGAQPLPPRGRAQPLPLGRVLQGRACARSRPSPSGRVGPSASEACGASGSPGQQNV